VATVLVGKHPRLRPSRRKSAPSRQSAKAHGGPRRTRGVVVLGVVPRSAAGAAGLRPGDLATAIDRAPIRDFLDFYLASFGPEHSVEIMRAGRRLRLNIDRTGNKDLGVEIDTGRVRRCTNRCVFCFVDQLPPGLRPALYVKDEDYRLSFLHGNYLTLTNLKREDETRIIEHHLSPLYVSVHATDKAVRAALLGRRSGQAILKILKRLAARGTRFHAQIVLVPGRNDGAVLDRTLEDLIDPSAGVLSVAVVPVGLTCHRKGLEALRPVSRASARTTVDQVARLNRASRKRAGRGLVYASDELFIVAGRAIPAAAYYDDFPQMENGVGLVRHLMDQLARVAPPARLRGRRIVLVTAALARLLITRLAAKLRSHEVDARVVPVENNLFGPTVTVSGLLAGRDVLAALRSAPSYDVAVLPPDMVNSGGLTLDDLSVPDLAAAAGAPMVVADYDLKTTLSKVEAALAHR
jgi:putative radical SAM enzyme (TIGR03279 family)